MLRYITTVSIIVLVIIALGVLTRVIVELTKMGMFHFAMVLLFFSLLAIGILVVCHILESE